MVRHVYDQTRIETNHEMTTFKNKFVQLHDAPASPVDPTTVEMMSE